jgi:hypothetical protein
LYSPISDQTSTNRLTTKYTTKVRQCLKTRSVGTFFFFIHSVCCFFTPADVNAQELQRTAYTFLNVTPSARIGGLGGVNVSLTDRDVNTFLSNPSSVGDTLAGTAALNYQFYVADIGHAAFTYLGDFGKAGLLGVGINHFSYGNIDGYDLSGNPTSNFDASETAIIISKSHQISHFRMGVSMKAAFSSLAGYRSSALMFDVGGMFIHPTQNWQIGLVLKNAGVLLSDYSEGSQSSLPIDLQVGGSIKPEHMPFRFSITAYRLIQSRGVEYLQNQPKSPSSLQKVIRHFNFGAELLLHKNVNILFGYNYGIRQELKLENAGGSAGLSFGFSARIKTVEFVFSRSTFVSGSAGYAFTLSANVDRVLRRK